MFYDYITSESGERMMGYITDNYQRSRHMQTVFQSMGLEIDALEEFLNDLYLQLFPKTATWGLAYYEQFLSIKPSPGDSIDVRRARVMAKLITRVPMTRRRMEYILSMAAGLRVYIKEYFSEYLIELIFKNGQPSNFYEIAEFADDLRPAHLELLHIFMEYFGLYFHNTIIEATVQHITHEAYIMPRMKVRLFSVNALIQSDNCNVSQKEYILKTALRTASAFTVTEGTVQLIGMDSI